MSLDSKMLPPRPGAAAIWALILKRGLMNIKSVWSEFEMLELDGA
jgi:hypothetical protein